MKLCNEFVIIFMSSLITLSCFGQYVPEDETAEPDVKKEETFNINDRLFYSGGFGASFGDLTYLELSPMVGISLTDRARAGLGITYIYFSDNRLDYSTNIYGGRIFGQYDIYQSFFGHAELELLNGQFGLRGERRDITSVFVGGGYRSTLGGRFFANIMLLYNVTEDIYSPYTNPLIRAGFGFGL